MHQEKYVHHHPQWEHLQDAVEVQMWSASGLQLSVNLHKHAIYMK